MWLLFFFYVCFLYFLFLTSWEFGLIPYTLILSHSQFHIFFSHLFLYINLLTFFKCEYSYINYEYVWNGMKISLKQYFSNHEIACCLGWGWWWRIIQVAGQGKKWTDIIVNQNRRLLSVRFMVEQSSHEIACCFGWGWWWRIIQVAGQGKRWTDIIVNEIDGYLAWDLCRRAIKSSGNLFAY